MLSIREALQNPHDIRFSTICVLWAGRRAGAVDCVIDRPALSPYDWLISDDSVIRLGVTDTKEER